MVVIIVSTCLKDSQMEMAAFVLFMISILSFVTPVVVAHSSKTIIILAGQSNMAGRGGVTDGVWDGIVPPACTPNPMIQRLNAKFQWVEAEVPLHADMNTRNDRGIGPGMPFANNVVANRSGVSIGLVPCAVGGTRIEQWEKGEELFENMVKRAKAARCGTTGGEIRAVLWYQGESDTTNSMNACSYRGKIEKFIGDIRTDLGLPNLLFIQVGLASGMLPYLGVVREAQMGVDITNVVTVDANGLALEEDNLHLTTNSQVQLGAMLAHAYLQHTP